MAKVLTTKGLAAALEEVILEAEKEIYLLSFSYIISDSFISRLKQATERNIIINIVYGKSIRDDTYKQLKGLPNTRIFHFENLHAKVFANETNCIIGSMNFSEASELGNTELGVLLDHINDKQAFTRAISHCKEIVQKAKLERPMMPKSIIDENRKNGKTKKTTEQIIAEIKAEVSTRGYCIRTGKRIPLDLKHPYSKEAYAEWQEEDDGDEECGETFDHFTGERSNGKTTKLKPILSKNWKKFQSFVESLSVKYGTGQ